MRPSSSLWLADTRVDVVALLSFAFGFESVIYMNDDDDDPLQAVRKYLSWPNSSPGVGGAKGKYWLREREWDRTPTSSGLLFFSVSVRPSLQSVWPDLAKFQHFGKNYIVYGNFLVWFFVWYLANFCTRKFMPMGKFSMIQAPKDWKIRWPPSHTGCSLLVWELSSCVMASPVCRRIGQRMQ